MSTQEKETSFGSRLRRERERLGLTQQQFAELVGVSRMTQVNYESGKRFPGEDYLAALERLGEKVDRFYLFMGRREEHMTDEALATTFLLTELAEVLELERSSLLDVLEELTHMTGPAVELDDTSKVEQLAKHRILWALSKSPSLVDGVQLTSALEAVEASISELGAIVDPKKKVRIALMAYRQAKTTGALDQRLIESAIALAE